MTWSTEFDMLKYVDKHDLRTAMMPQDFIHRLTLYGVADGDFRENGVVGPENIKDLLLLQMGLFDAGITAPIIIIEEICADGWRYIGNQNFKKEGAKDVVQEPTEASKAPAPFI